jgi:hypothetical protein
MTKFIAAFAFASVAATSAYAQSLSEAQVEGIQNAIKAAGCTVEDTALSAEGDGYKADGVVCGDEQFHMMLDKDFKITDKKKGNM